MQKAVILVSGGLDSATCLAKAKQDGYECHALSFDYGQRHRAELEAAKRVAQALGAIEHRVICLSLGELVQSALTDTSMTVPDYQGDGKIPATYVPARNTVFLSIALGWAEVLDADALFAGMSSVDYSGYPDCRPEYLDAFQTLANLATKRGVEGHPIEIHTPLLYLDKAQTILLGHQLGVDYGLTVSCYQATESGEACGRCDSCVLRRQGFDDAKLPDPTRYRGC